MNESTHALQLVRRYWAQRGPAIDPTDIAEQMGVRVVAFDNWFETASGLYSADEVPPTIYYNGTEAKVRQRFTIAHELGHHVLGHGTRNRDTSNAFRMSNPDPAEVAANRFAAHLLMPDYWVEHFVITEGLTSLEQLAKKFDVSTSAMHFKLRSLRLV